jgi:RNA polymerase sigma-70 factor, ECF subfamily
VKLLPAWASPPIEESDERLIAQSRQGDDPAFGRLVERHKSYAYWLACRWLGRNDNEAYEAVQQSFIKVKIALEQFDCRRATFRTWLWDIVRNTCMDMRRREKVRPKPRRKLLLWRG